MQQKIYNGINNYQGLCEILQMSKAKKYMLVCGKSFHKLQIKDWFLKLNVNYVEFNGFKPNPLYEDIVNGVNLFKEQNCDGIIAVGGGSAMDVAKCIKLFAVLDNNDVDYVKQPLKDSTIPFIAIPTTAGTGSEATRVAVIYYKGAKLSVNHDSTLPNYVVLEPSVLKNLPKYQKACTLLDALAQAIESWWSTNSTDESKQYAQDAVKLIVDNYLDYFSENPKQETYLNILLGANLAGKAINITKTTAPHAMSYKITLMYNVPHGLAVMTTLPQLFVFMQDNLGKVQDSRGKAYVEKTFNDIVKALGCNSVKEVSDKINNIMKKLNIEKPKYTKDDELKTLVDAINVEKLKSNPIALTIDDCYAIYKQSLS